MGRGSSWNFLDREGEDTGEGEDVKDNDSMVMQMGVMVVLD